MNAKITVKCVLGVAQTLSGFCAVCNSRRCVDENAGSFDFLRLIGMKYRQGIEASIQGPGPLPAHQGHIGPGAGLQAQNRTSKAQHRAQKKYPPAPPDGSPVGRGPWVRLGVFHGHFWWWKHDPRSPVEVARTSQVPSSFTCCCLFLGAAPTAPAHRAPRPTRHASSGS